MRRSKLQIYNVVCRLTLDCQREREREREREKERDRDRQRETETERERQRQREIDRERQIERDTQRRQREKEVRWSLCQWDALPTAKVTLGAKLDTSSHGSSQSETSSRTILRL